jgi:hypothetical protein
VRASVFEYDWSNVAAAIMNEYSNVLTDQTYTSIER